MNQDLASLIARVDALELMQKKHYSTLSDEQMGMFHGALNNRLKSQQHEANDHLDRGLSPLKITPGVDSQVLRTIASYGQVNAEWSAPFPLVSTLPSSPYDGQVVAYQSSGMATDGIMWLFKYRLASGSSYKWECIGAMPWGSEADTPRTYTSATYGSLATDPITVTTPLAGDYYVHQGAYISGNTAAADYYLSYKIGGTAASDTDAILAERVTSASGSNIHSLWRMGRINAVAASTALLEQARVTSGTGTYAHRSLFITPIRVSA